MMTVSNLMSDSISTIFLMLKKIKCDNNAYSLFLELWVPTFNTEQYFHSPLPLLKAIFLCIHGDWCPHIMKTFIISSFTQNQSCINKTQWMRNIIKKIYILNNMTVMWGFHHISFEVAGLLACCIKQLGSCFLTSWRNIQPSSPGLWVMLELTSQKMKVVHSSEMLGSNYSITQTNNPQDLLLQYDNTFATNTVFQCCVISSW
jgi:hypothetical protein